MNSAPRGARNSFQYDGVPVETVNIGAETNNTVLYERVWAWRRRPAGRCGHPSAAVNMVRKQADSKVITGSASAEVGSWIHCAATVDITTHR